ncbi:hypothetical protein LY474_11105 [Myxococcus stipitatus]|uniref:hypothetical protein n=1 Tax=Myxococcus stipitatus TaxID=83455 RepID=UPI001F1CCF7D|nr:hypothetical protein [Myxococcus stipitatus]MCE9668360.1 hypothetical protein [Myxococcus stipitatus]
MELDGFVIKFPGQSFRFRNAMAESDISGFATALEAIDALRTCGWEPLSAETVVTCVDPESAEDTRPAKPHWRLSRTAIPPGVILQAMMTNPDPVYAQAERLSRPVLEAWLSGSLTNCGCEKPGWRPEWRELRFDACRAWGGSRDWRGTQDAVRLRTDAGVLTVPLERDEQGTWLSGPRDPVSDQPPLAVSIHQRWETLTLGIAVNYSYWLQEGEPASARFKASLALLEALGWEQG